MLHSKNKEYTVVCIDTPKGVKGAGAAFKAPGKGRKKHKIISHHRLYRPAVKKAKAVVKQGAKRCMVRDRYKAIYTTGRI